MKQIIRYDFTIEAVSPLHVGTEKSGQESKLIRDADQCPFIPGNSLGGALREYLKRVGVSDSIILKYLGGTEADNPEAFLTSGVYISDAILQGTAESRKREGTAIDPAFGAAKQQSKYTLEYLPAGVIFSFCIEAAVADQVDQDNDVTNGMSALELEKVVGTWTRGLAKRQLLLGGQKSLGFGSFTLKYLKKTVFRFNTRVALDHYIFHREEIDGVGVDWRVMPHYPLRDDGGVGFEMTGAFPYGVYQSFPVCGEQAERTNRLTGLLKQQTGSFIPAASLKGILRHEIRLLLKRMTGKLSVEEKLEELFGGLSRKGKLIVFDIELKDERLVQIERYSPRKNAWEKGDPVYIKIDRLTGGAYDSALKYQREMQGKATIRLTLKTAQAYVADYNPYLFPLVYALRKIGAGAIPLGGRTVIGLGQFAAEKLQITINDSRYTIETAGEENLHLLKAWFDSFRRWCEDAEFS